MVRDSGADPQTDPDSDSGPAYRRPAEHTGIAVDDSSRCLNREKQPKSLPIYWKNV